MPKPTQHEISRRVNEICEMLRGGCTLGQINQHLKKAYKVKTRTCANYIARARRRIYDAIKRTDEDLRAESLAFYEGVRADLDQHIQWRLKAQERMDALMALERPKKVALTDANGGPATIRLEAERLEQVDPGVLAQLAAAFDQVQRIAVTPPEGSG